MNTIGMEREDRRSKRKLVNKLVKYFLIPSVMTNAFDGLITDVSDSGLCLLTNCQLKYGQRIVIQGEPYLSEKVAIVRWSQKFDDIFYRIGLEFAEDQAFMNIKGIRRYKRLHIKNLNIHGKMVLAKYVKIIDMSLNGLSIETDRKLNVGREYILRVEYEGKTWPIKGYIVWSILKECKSSNKENTVPIYIAGMKLTTAPNEMREIIKFIELKQKRGEKRECFSLSLDELNIRRKDRRTAESLHPASK